MPDTAFDRWTRRRVGQVAGALITVPILGGTASPAAAKHHHGKKKKKKKKEDECIYSECQGLGESCNPFGSPCCNCWECANIGEGPNVPYVCVG